jgi:glutaminyl-peptide cyclotransferase
MKPDRARRVKMAFRKMLRPAACAFIFSCLFAFSFGCKPNKPAIKNKPAGEIWKEFSGENAFSHTKNLVEFGPRPAGSNQLAKSRDYIVQALRESGWDVELQKFTDATPRGPVDFVNLIARFPKSPGKPAGVDTQQVIVASHYDTKLFDTIRFVGASDGASSSGALLELARVLATAPDFAQKIELVFFDGEEAVQQFSETDGLYGSRFYAKQLRDSKRNRQFKSGVLWDMIGDKDLTITLPPDSPPQLAKSFFESADALNLRKYFSYLDRDLLDDHVPLSSAMQANIPTIDIIDFDYAYWHTADDTLDKLSPGSLQTVGAVTLRHLSEILSK